MSGTFKSRGTSIAAGKRDIFVRIEQLVQAAGGSGSGFPVEEWVPLADEWMSRTDVAADERFVAGAAQEAAYATSRWRLSYRADMDPDAINVATKRRLRLGTRVFDIQFGTVVKLGLDIELLTLAKD